MRMLWLFLLAMISLLASSCDSTDKGGGEGTEGDDVNVVIVPDTDTVLVDEELLQRLEADLGLSNVRDNVKGIRIRKREPVPNRHLPEQIDTIYTLISEEGSRFLYYHLPESDFLLKAHIRESGLSLGEGLEVGQSPAAVREVLPPLSSKDTMPQSIILEGEITPRSLELHLSEGELKEMVYTGYVD